MAEPDTGAPARLFWTRRVSLATRILAVNVIALVLLAGSLFYLDSYRNRLIAERFGLARAGFTDGTLETTAKITLDQKDGGFVITRSDLTLKATIAGIEEEQFAEIAADAERNCPVSKVLNAEITLDASLV